MKNKKTETVKLCWVCYLIFIQRKKKINPIKHTFFQFLMYLMNDITYLLVFHKKRTRVHKK